jgi:AcrR family transcriptional regulator
MTDSQYVNIQMTVSHMEGAQLMTTTKRAYSDEAKQAREDKIISAAETLLMEKGYYAINMDQVAQAAGLAKGTVYLYFKTREELFLTVFERQGTIWLNEIQQALSGSMLNDSRDALADLLVRTLARRPLLTRLVALSTIIFEYNLSIERAREHKLWIYGNLTRIGEQIDAAFSLHPGQGAVVLLQMFIIVAGLEGFAHPSPIMAQVYEKEPTLTKLDFEVELKRLLLVVLKASSVE